MQNGVHLGDFIDDLRTNLTRIFIDAPQYIDIAARVLQDPAFPQVVSLVNRIANAAAAQTAPIYPTTSYTPPAGYPSDYKGVGLDKAVFPLEVFAWYVENPILAGMLVAAVLATPLFVGYYYGKSLGKGG